MAVAQSRSAPLDGLRGIAVALVVAVHASAFLDPNTFPHVVAGGFLGVTIFFALSGYLITGLLIRDVNTVAVVRLGRFYLRRAWRLLPALGVVTAAHAVYAAVTGLSLAREWAWAAATAGYSSNWYYQLVHQQTNRGLDHFWSLSVEEQFYLLWPVLLAWWWKRGGRRSVVQFAATLVLISVALSAVAWHSSHDWLGVYFRSDVEAGPLLVGCLLALRPVRLPPRAGAVAGAAALTGVLSLAWTTHREDSWLYARGGLVLVALLVAVVIAHIEGPVLGRVLAVKPLAGLGRMSYSLYLWHFPVFVAVYDAHLPPSRALPLGLAVALAAAAASYLLVERPLLTWRDRRFAPAATVGRSLSRHNQPLADAALPGSPAGAVASATVTP